MCGSGKLGVHAFHKRFGTTVIVLSDIALQVFTKAGGNVFHFVHPGVLKPPVLGL